MGWTKIGDKIGRKALYECVCGLTKMVNIGSVNRGASKMCSECSYKLRRLQVEAGQIFGSLMVRSSDSIVIKDNACVECECVCGDIKYYRIKHLYDGAKTCFNCINIIDGRSKLKSYRTWSGIIRRCTDKEDKDYINYGGRGITVCNEWLDPFIFNDWYLENYIDGYTIDRIDVNKNYTPNNCRYADAKTQRINQRWAKYKNKTTNVIGVTYRKNRDIYEVRCKKHYIGSYKNLIDAKKARLKYLNENNLDYENVRS